MGLTPENQHRRIQQDIDDEKVKTHLDLRRHRIFLGVLNKVSRHALNIVQGVFDKYLPYGPEKATIQPCSGVLRRTMGVPCKHTVRHHYDTNSPIPISEFHAHWRLYAGEDLPPIDPR